MLNTADTIAAISSSSGVSQRGIVRVSGDLAVGAADKIFSPSTPDKNVADMEGFTCCDGFIDADGAQFPARIYVFRTPRSYTRQDLVEFHVPGNPYVLDILMEALLDEGCRQAGAGEFTARAFFSGRIDLSQAQAVGDVIEADDDQQLRSAVSVLGGVIHRLCSQTAFECTDILAVVEASIDLADEDIELEKPSVLAGRLNKLADKLVEVARSACEIPEKAHHPVVVIAGRPNVGKSSLLNCLSGTDRAIVSALAGTTRDVLSCVIELNGHDVEFRDVAGFMAAEDEIQQAADQAAQSAVRQADVILMVQDITCDDLSEDMKLFEEIRETNRLAKVVWLANKCDVSASNVDINPETLLISANTGMGIGPLRQQLAEILQLSVARGGGALGLHTRQKRCLIAAGDSARRASQLLSGAGSVVDVSELTAIDIRECLNNIGQISGQVVNEDVLGRIFERFCVGK